MLKSVRGGMRLQRPARCPEDVFEAMEKCWNKVSSRRPTFAEMKTFLQVNTIGFIVLILIKRFFHFYDYMLSHFET